jgi:glycosidase
MSWGEEQDRDLFAFYQELCRIRKSERALTHGVRQTIPAAQDVLAYRRVLDGSTILTVMNISDRPCELELTSAESHLQLATNPDCRVEAGEQKTRFHLPPFGGVILK